MGGIRRSGGRVVLTVMCIVVACAGQVPFAGTVGAQEGVYRSANECIAAKPAQVDVYAWRCVGDSSGQWRATLSRELATASGSELFSTFLIIALFWSLVPLCVAVALARRRGESPGMAVLLSLFLGWMGLAIVYFGQSNTRRSLEGVAASAAARRLPLALPRTVPRTAFNGSTYACREVTDRGRVHRATPANRGGSLTPTHTAKSSTGSVPRC